MPKKSKFIVTYAPREKPPTLDETVRGIMGIPLAEFIDEILSPNGKYHRICKKAENQKESGDPTCPSG